MIVLRDSTEHLKGSLAKERRAAAHSPDINNTGMFLSYTGSVELPHMGPDISYCVKLQDPWNDAEWPGGMSKYERLMTWILVPGMTSEDWPLISPSFV